MIDEKKVYQDIWNVINLHTVFNKQGFVKRIDTRLPADLVKFIIAVLKSEEKNDK